MMLVFGKVFELGGLKSIPSNSCGWSSDMFVSLV